MRDLGPGQPNSWSRVQLVYDPQLYKDLLDGGVDDLMAKHIAHLFVREALNQTHFCPLLRLFVLPVPISYEQP